MGMTSPAQPQPTCGKGGSVASDRVRIGSSHMGMISGGTRRSSQRVALHLALDSSSIIHRAPLPLVRLPRRWPHRWNDVEDFVGFIVSPATASAMDRFVKWLCEHCNSRPSPDPTLTLASQPKPPTLHSKMSGFMPRCLDVVACNVSCHY